VFNTNEWDRKKKSKEIMRRRIDSPVANVTKENYFEEKEKKKKNSNQIVLLLILDKLNTK
jgi:hypothetical protein